MFLHVLAPSWWDKSMSWVIQKSLENANLKLKTPVGPLHADLSWAELANNDESFLPRTTKCEHSLTHSSISKTKTWPQQNKKSHTRVVQSYLSPARTQQTKFYKDSSSARKKKKSNSKSQNKSRVKERKVDHLYCRSSNTHYHHCSR